MGGLVARNFLDGDARLSNVDRVVAAFDFDGTLTNQDSFIRFLAWKRPLAAFAVDVGVTTPTLLLHAAGIVGNDAHKMALFARQFSGSSYGVFKESATEFASKRIPSLLRLEAVRRLRAHVASGHHVVIVTASVPEWITPWAVTEGVSNVIGSELEIRDGKITGKLRGSNCYGAEKVRRLLALRPDRHSYTLIAYGDSLGDKEMLAAADVSYYRRFS
jgi:phosphatidylglycerophosphatase C